MGLGAIKQSKQSCHYHLSEPEQLEGSYSRMGMSEVVQRLRPAPEPERVTGWRKLPLLSIWVLFRACLWREEFSMACALSARRWLPREQAPSCAVNKKLAQRICKSFTKTGTMNCAHNRVAIRSVDPN